MSNHVLFGFGFGPIQSGLFINEAFHSGNFRRIVISEIDSKLVNAVQANNGTYYVNVAGNDGIENVRIDNVELFNPNSARDRELLLEALAESTEIVTSLPSVSFYTTGGSSSVVNLLSRALQQSKASASIIYTAENNNHAAEILRQHITEKTTSPIKCNTQYLNTVIGKMSQVITDPAEIAQMNLKPIAPGIERAFLVEQFNRILVTRCTLEGFRPGIEVFLEKDDLIPFEEAKLYGHNAIHALLAYLGACKGYVKMTELKNDSQVMQIARDAFLNESGSALIAKYAQLNDQLFTVPGYRDFAEDLLRRMTNPYLTDTIARAGRDIVRKLGYSDRIFGTMSVALEQNIQPQNMALAAAAGLAALFNPLWQTELPDNLRQTSWQQLTADDIKNILMWLWNKKTDEHTDQLIKLTQKALPRLISLLEQ